MTRDSGRSFRHSTLTFPMTPAEPMTTKPGVKDPYRALLTAVLMRAVLDYTVKEGTLRERAKSWIWPEDEDENIPLSFDWICLHLDLCPIRIRENLKGVLLERDSRGRVLNVVRVKRQIG